MMARSTGIQLRSSHKKFDKIRRSRHGSQELSSNECGICLRVDWRSDIYHCVSSFSATAPFPRIPTNDTHSSAK